LFQAGFSPRWKLRPENGYRADIARVNKTSGDGKGPLLKRSRR
jgi:hypothetical protein